MGGLCSGAHSLADNDATLHAGSSSSFSSTASGSGKAKSSKNMLMARSAFVASHAEKWDEVYEIVKHLGEGITGAVHLVRHKRTGELYAKKSINLEDQDPAQTKELINEINLLRVLDHPNIVHLYEYFNYKDEMHLIMENLEGGELFSMLRSGKNHHEFTEDEVASICHGALSALAYCHARNIVHRDLKPQNIVFPTKGDLSDVKIIDFGMSKRGMKKTMFGRRAVQTACGTPLYVAPEIILGARYDEKIDVWAIGVLAYHMASGKHPFQGRSQDETLENIERHRGAQFPGKQWREKSQLMKSFIEQLLRPQISRRPSSAEALKHPFLQKSPANFVSPAISRRVSDAEAAFQVSYTGHFPQKNAHAHVVVESLPPLLFLYTLLLSNCPKLQLYSHMILSHHILWQRMAEFSSYPDIKRAALMAIAHKLHSNQIADLRHAFQKIDVKNTGTIDRNEFEQLANSLQKDGKGSGVLGKEFSKDELKVIFDAADVDGSGEIAYAEFLAATLDTKVFLREDRLRDAFASLDSDGSNTITAENLAALVGKEFRRSEIDEMIKAADVKGTGNIDFEEFLILMRGREGGENGVGDEDEKEEDDIIDGHSVDVQVL